MVMVTKSRSRCHGLGEFIVACGCSDSPKEAADPESEISHIYVGRETAQLQDQRTFLNGAKWLRYPVGTWKEEN